MRLLKQCLGKGVGYLREQPFREKPSKIFSFLAILVPRPRIEPIRLQWKRGVLTTGPPGKSQKTLARVAHGDDQRWPPSHICLLFGFGTAPHFMLQDLTNKAIYENQHLYFPLSTPQRPQRNCSLLRVSFPRLSCSHLWPQQGETKFQRPCPLHLSEWPGCFVSLLLYIHWL